MLSYQHSYHAGCLADVHKHAALSVILATMVEKDKPISYVETHAGRGLYDLSSVEALKTGEAEEGILALLKSGGIPESHPYFKAIQSVRKRYGSAFYPGSPLIAQSLLRESDRLTLMELHPQEYEALKRITHPPSRGGELLGNNVTVRKADGLKEALAFAPPQIRRGLTLIDPSYEVKAEYAQVADFVLKLHGKWPVAVILLWYPLLKERYHLPLVRMLEDAALPRYWRQEIMFGERTKQRALGTGLIGVNLPYGAQDRLEEIKGLVTGR